MKTTLIIVILLALGVGGYALTKKTAAPVPIDEIPVENERVRGPEDRSIAVGKPTEISGITVTVNKVTDSRCPAKVQCVWAGEATASVTLAQGDKTSAVDIKLGAEATEFEGYLVSLTAALPYPQEPGSIAQDDYMLTFHVAPVIGSDGNIPANI